MALFNYLFVSFQCTTLYGLGFIGSAGNTLLYVLGGSSLKTFYTVDRNNSLHEGKIIELNIRDDLSPATLKNHAYTLFPRGLSAHGENYFIKATSRANNDSVAIELFFEYVRQAHFQNVISRFQCLFACDSIEEAKKFKSKYGNESSRIFEVQSVNNHFKANMRILDNNQSSLFYSYLAHQYWSGFKSDLPELIWEVLLELPVTIGKQIE